MSLQLEKVEKIDKLIFLEFNAVNILIYCNNKEGIEPIFKEINKLADKEVQFNKILKILDDHAINKVVLNKRDIEIMKLNSQSSLDFAQLIADKQKALKYIFVSA